MGGCHIEYLTVFEWMSLLAKFQFVNTDVGYDIFRYPLLFSSSMDVIDLLERGLVLQFAGIDFL